MIAQKVSGKKNEEFLSSIKQFSTPAKMEKRFRHQDPTDFCPNVVDDPSFKSSEIINERIRDTSDKFYDTDSEKDGDLTDELFDFDPAAFSTVKSITKTSIHGCDEKVGKRKFRKNLNSCLLKKSSRNLKIQIFSIQYHVV